MTRPVVHLYTVCWNEADMLGFFFRHYDPWIDRYVIYDDGSTDGSIAILQAHPKVELRRFERSHAESFVLSHKAMQDEAWKASRGLADWVCITAIDEHLHAGAKPMGDVLAEAQGAGVTLLPALGFDMNHPEMPEDEGLLIGRVTRGRPRIAFNKLSLFRPDFVRDTGFGPGRHAAEPSGDLVLPSRDTVMLWHYKHLGFERNAMREAAQKDRLGSVDIAHDFASHYRWTKERLRSFWQEMQRESYDLTEPDFAPNEAAVRPLWWDERPNIRRQMPRPAAAVAAPANPTVSVLVKAYNHAAYIGRTIESVLEQSFQDFEIVVTDDGSTDGTAAAVARYNDPRIRMDVLPENRGISGAMNATIARAKGRYLAILNSDDWALPNRLKQQVEFLEANPHVSLVFGMPRTVDETGQPRQSFFDFEQSLRLEAASPNTWLKHFFEAGNCLCAPTAMIRSEVYKNVGLYDVRLTNLQDFDMWIRICMANFEIRILPEFMTAFRIRDADANMSAPKTENVLRHVFENSKILRQFAEISPERFENIFQVNSKDFSSVAVCLANLALRCDNPAHHYLALDLIFEHASTQDDINKLRAMSGSVDVFKIERVAALERHAKALEDHARALEERETASLAARDLRLAEQSELITALTEDRAAAVASTAKMMNSLSWRSTAFIRWIERSLKSPGSAAKLQ